jgi:EmrB/QacA subfamily drug resistance transporter
MDVGGPADRVALRFATAQGRWVLTATVLGSGMGSIDATVVNIALPAVGRTFSTGTGALQLIVSAYSLTLAALLLLGGALGDSYGRRRLFMFGTVWFVAASVLCALAPDVWVLVVARAVQGVGAALLTPGSLAILEASFTADDRARAIGAWSGVSGVATALGPLLGGYLIAAVSWRGVFFINVPVGAAVLLLSARHIPESRDPNASGRLDVAGATLVTVGLAGLTYGFVAAGSRGWSAPVVLVALSAGTASLAGFLGREATASRPMLPLAMFRSSQFRATNAVTFIVYGALGGSLFLLPVELEQAGGYSPLAAGASLLPITAIMLALSARSGALASRIGPRLQMSVGPILVGAGLALMLRVGPHVGYPGKVLPALVVFSLGLATTVAPLTSTVMAAAPAERAGIASAVNNGVARSAGLLAVAVLPVASGITGSAYRQPGALNAGFHRASSSPPWRPPWPASWRG